MSDDKQRTEWRDFRFHLAQILMFLGAVTIWVVDLFGKGSWWVFGTGVAVLYAMKLRYDRRDLRVQLVKVLGQDVPEPADDPDEHEQLRRAIAIVSKGAMASADLIQPIIDAAHGQRIRLEQQGWSPTMAESMAAQYYAVTVNRLLGTPEEDE